MTTLLNDNKNDPLFQVQVNLWHSTLQDSMKAGLDLDGAIANSDKAVKQFKKRFKLPIQPEPVPAPQPLGTSQSYSEAFPEDSDPTGGDEYPSPETSGTH